MSGNGVDLTAACQVLGTVAGDVRDLRVETRRGLDVTRHELSGVKRELATLRRTAAKYHASVLGHRVLTSEADERLRRVEERRGLRFAA